MRRPYLSGWRRTRMSSQHGRTKRIVNVFLDHKTVVRRIRRLTMTAPSPFSTCWMRITSTSLTGLMGRIIFTLVLRKTGFFLAFAMKPIIR